MKIIRPLKLSVAAGTMILLTMTVLAGDDFPFPAVEAGLKGAVVFSRKSGYSKTISDMYLGYDKDGKVVVGIGIRSVRTYKKIKGVVVVREKNGAYIIENAVFPDIGKIGNLKKRKKVLQVLKGIVGHVIKDNKGNIQKVDAISGATRYRKRIYINLESLARKTVEEMENNPKWLRRRCPEQSK